MADHESLHDFIEQRVNGADLTPERAEWLAAELAERPELWRQHVLHSDDKRVYASLYRDHHLDVWLICWTGSQDTGLHDHDLSGGAVRVVDGALDEDRLRMGAGIDTTRYGAGESFNFDATRIHDVRHAGELPTVSLHLYSPPLWRMGHYAVDADGHVTRTSTSYAEELRPDFSA
jgi:hypothetical protein